MHPIVFCRFVQIPVTTPEDEKFPLSNDSRDDQNDRINGQLLEMLKHLQQLDAPCAAEQRKGNSSLLDVCTILKVELQSFGQNISDFRLYLMCKCKVYKSHIYHVS